MIPPAISPDIKSSAEKRIFEWFRNAPGTDKWIVLHSLGITVHNRVIHGETDFLVLAPGLGMFSLEVKGGRVRRQLGKWRFINRYGEWNEKVRGPFDQAWEGIYSIRKSIETKLDKEHEHLKSILFGIGVMFPDIDFTSVGVDEEAWQVFDIHDGKNVRDFIERISEGAINNLKRLGYTISDEMLPTEEDVEYLASVLRGDFDFNVPLIIKQRYAEEGFISLTNEQALCLEQLDENPRTLIRGTAGTGKTLLAIEAAKRAALNGEKVALFCFNRLLGDWISDCFQDVPVTQRPIFAGTFHKFMWNLLKSRGIRTEEPSGTENSNLFFQKILPEQTIKQLEIDPLQFDRIIVDEAQDLINDHYLGVMDRCLINGLSKGKWTMFGDFSMQSIYTYGLSENDYLNNLQEYSFFTLFRLTKNCRNTKKICIDIESIVGIPENAAFEDTVDTPPVNHFVYTDIQNQKEKLVSIIELIQSEGIQNKDIVILSPRRKEDSVVGRLSGIIVEDYSIRSTGRIRFSTIQAFKGLESSIVILTDIGSYEDTKLIYVGMSRARFGLYILETNEASKMRNELVFNRRIRDV